MAHVVRALGGQRLTERAVGFDRGTVRKGEHELRTGIVCVDGRAGNRRRGVLERLPNLERDMRNVVDCWSQTDPRFRTTQRYSDLTVAEVVQRLIEDKGPEVHSRRTRFMERMVGFADSSALDIKLAYYSPYHSKYNPAERPWAVLEKRCNGTRARHD